MVQKLPPIIRSSFGVVVWFKMGEPLTFYDVRAVYRNKDEYLFADDTGETCAVLPVHEVRCIARLIAKPATPSNAQS